jgi:hypothetical protein
VLQAAWTAIQQRHPDVPEALLTISPEVARGCFGATRWGRPISGTHSQYGDAVVLAVPGRLLSEGGTAVLCELLHQAVHLVNAARGTKDISSAGRYHNHHFAALANELGLSTPDSPELGTGFKRCLLLAPQSAPYAAVIEALDAQALLHLPPAPRPRVSARPVGTKGNRAGKRFTISCSCQAFPVTPAVYEGPGLLCAGCGERLTSGRDRTV